MIIGISGYKGSGKDTAGQVLIDKFGFTKASFAAPIKDMVSEQFGIDRFMLEGTDCKMREMRDNPKFGAYGLSPRQLLQKLGTFYNSEISTTYWSDMLEKEYKSQFGNDFVVTDVRFPCEVEMIERNGGKVIRINRPGFTGEDHVSERSLCDWPFDTVISNHKDMDFLREQTEALMKVIV